MRATTSVILAAGLLLGGLVFAALLLPDDERLGGGAADPFGLANGAESPIGKLVEESLRHAHEADAAITDGRLRREPELRARTEAEGAGGDPSTWRPPLHDLPQGVYHDPHSLLVVGPRWVYEWRAMRQAWHPASATGLIPEASMGYLDQGHFVRWAASGWLPNDVDGAQHARRRTRLYRDGADVCLDPRCDRRLRFSSMVDAQPATLWGSLPPSTLHRHSRLGGVLVTTRIHPLSTRQAPPQLSFAVSWIDRRGVTHMWGTRDGTVGVADRPRPMRLTRRPPPASRVRPHAAPALREGWPPVHPEQLRCVCQTTDCAEDDRSEAVLAAQQIEQTGMPWVGPRWRCDRPRAKRRWSLHPVGLEGEAVLERGYLAGPWLRLPAPLPLAMNLRGVPTRLEVRDDAGEMLWQFIAMTDGTLHATAAGPGAPKKVILQPLP